LDLDFFQRRIAQAAEYRLRMGFVAEAPHRVVWSESDGIPGLIVDRYGDCAVIQTLTLAMDQRLPLIVEALQSTLPVNCVIERNDATVRAAEGMEERTGTLAGTYTAPTAATLGGLHFDLDLLRGHKTGFYLDQVRNHAVLSRYASGRRVLDCFSNQGAFALACARADAMEVTAVEVSADACRQIDSNARRNGLRVRVTQADVFDDLAQREREGAKFDLVILDPPSFAKARSRKNDALRGYKELHLRALRLLQPGGMLATFSCSHHIGHSEFLETVNAATVDSRRTLRLIETFSQSLDHPIISTIPESEYLKGYLFELAPGR
jgi:23S rRNA (cytosine1962-C5)-methyltransferase